MATIICSKCSVEKDESEYFRNRHALTGRASECKACFKWRCENNINGIRDRRLAYARRPDQLDKNAKRLRKRYLDNRQELNAYQRQWRAKNRDKMRAYINAYMKRKRQESANYRISHRIRNRIREALKKGQKRENTRKLLGCSWEDFRIHLESQFTAGMTWEAFNNGEIHIDHIIPCCAFDLSKEEEQRKCFHYTNLQPLWAADNLTKISNDHQMKRERLSSLTSEELGVKVSST